MGRCTVGLDILKSRTLGEALSNKPSFVPLEGAINMMLLGKDPSGPNDRAILWLWDEDPCPIAAISS